MGSYRALHLACHSLSTERHVHVCKVGEGRTTMCCHRCGSVMLNVLDDEGRALRGLKLCRACHHTPCDDEPAHWVHLIKEPELHADCTPHGKLDGVRDDKGRELRRLKLCTHTWDAMHASKLRNRDLNAAMNIWKVLYALVHGLPRPEYLRMQRRERRPARGHGAAASGVARQLA